MSQILDELVSDSPTLRSFLKSIATATASLCATTLVGTSAAHAEEVMIQSSIVPRENQTAFGFEVTFPKHFNQCIRNRDKSFLVVLHGQLNSGCSRTSKVRA